MKIKKVKIETQKRKQMAIKENSRIIAQRMIIDGMPPEKISRMTGLSLEIIRELAGKIEGNFNKDAPVQRKNRRQRYSN